MQREEKMVNCLDFISHSIHYKFINIFILFCFQFSFVWQSDKVLNAQCYHCSNCTQPIFARPPAVCPQTTAVVD